MNDSTSQSPSPRIENLSVDLDVIAQRLYSAPNVLPRIVRDYGFGTTPASPRALAEALWAELGQTPIEDPHLQQPSNRTVFRAEALAAPEDVTGDGRVDIIDLVTVAHLFGQRGPPGFSPADLNRDGAVDIVDLVRVARRMVR